MELAKCLNALISKKYFTIDSLNSLIQKFPYHFLDKTNRPHVIQHRFSSKKTICGNVHENWNLLRLIPFMVGPFVPEGELAWKVILYLKDIVELVPAPVQTEETVAYLEFKISEHRQKYLELLPVCLLPKHHYLERYPQMIQ